LLLFRLFLGVQVWFNNLSIQTSVCHVIHPIKHLNLIIYCLCYYRFKISLSTLPVLPLCFVRIASRWLHSPVVRTEEEIVVIYIASSYFNKCNAG
jgi:hypothetical protein